MAGFGGYLAMIDVPWVVATPIALIAYLVIRVQFSTTQGIYDRVKGTEGGEQAQMDVLLRAWSDAASGEPKRQ